MILQAGSAIPSTPIELVMSATLPTKIVLAVLAVLSLFSWAASRRNPVVTTIKEEAWERT